MSVQYHPIEAGGRMPYFEFEARSEERRDETEKAGGKQFVTVDYVVLRQMGAKDSVEKNAVEWLQSLQNNANWRPEWVEKAKRDYDTWKSGMEPTPDGMHVSVWAAIDAGQRDTLLAANIRTVEDLAIASEPALMRVGIGARALQQKAKAWLESSDSFGQGAETMAAQQARIDAQDEKIKQLEERLKAALNKAPDPLG